MPWSETSLMNERMIFIAACLRREEPFSTVCGRLGISRKTGYKWLHRYEADGAAALADLSSARQTQSHAFEPAIADRLLALRRTRPTWGPRKLLARLAMDDSGTDWPAASTVGDLLRRHGLSKQRPRRLRPSGSKPALTEPTAPNESWSMDFKGWFRVGDGVRSEPLTVTDNHSRYLMVCQSMPQITAEHVQPWLVHVFRTHGLPRALRSDNGSPFASGRGLAGLTQLSIWLLTLNVWPDRIDPGRPDQNGRHERMHRTLREDAIDPPAPTVEAQQSRFDTWRLEFNTIRPHEALGAALSGSRVSAFAARLFRAYRGVGVSGRSPGKAV
jgi:transposase InsO family protein